ncbi:hypothetical protein RFI_19393, partial [Reticulomyxa filosa]
CGACPNYLTELSKSCRYNVRRQHKNRNLLTAWFSEFLKVQSVTVNCKGFMHSIFGECIGAIKYRPYCDPIRSSNNRFGSSPFASCVVSIDCRTLRTLTIFDNSVQDVHINLLRRHWLSLQEFYFYAATPVGVEHMHEHEFVLVLSRQCTQLKKLHLPNMVIPYEVLAIWLQQQLDFDVQLFVTNKQLESKQQKQHHHHHHLNSIHKIEEDRSTSERSLPHHNQPMQLHNTIDSRKHTNKHRDRDRDRERDRHYGQDKGKQEANDNDMHIVLHNEKVSNMLEACHQVMKYGMLTKKKLASTTLKEADDGYNTPSYTHKLAQEIVVQRVYGKSTAELEHDLNLLTKCQWKVQKVKHLQNSKGSWIIKRITL